MSHIINVLEQLAIDASLVNEENINKFIKGSKLPDELKQELINKNIDAIKETLQARSKIFCGIHPAEDESEEDIPEKDIPNKQSNINAKLVASC